MKSVSGTGHASIVIVDPVASWTPEQAATGSIQDDRAVPRERARPGRTGYPQAGRSDLTVPHPAR